MATLGTGIFFFEKYLILFDLDLKRIQFHLIWFEYILIYF